jgi:hypothetical protein
MTADDVKAFWSAVAADASPKAGVDFGKLLVDKSMLQPAKKKAKPGNDKTVLIADGCSIAGLLLLAGIIVKIRDKDGNEVARIELLEGGSASVQQSAVAAGKPPIATTTRPSVSFIPPPPAISNLTAAPRRPNAASKPEDLRRLLDTKFEVAVRDPSPFGAAAIDSKLNSGDTLPNGPVTIVAATAIKHQEAWDKHLGVPVENTVD